MCEGRKGLGPRDGAGSRREHRLISESGATKEISKLRDGNTESVGSETYPPPKEEPGLARFPLPVCW